MSDVGKVTIESVATPTGLARHVHATVNIGGSLVDVACESAQDPELDSLVDGLHARLTAIAVETVRASLHPESR